MKKNISFLLILLLLGSHLFAGLVMPFSGHRPEMEPNLFRNGFKAGGCIAKMGANGVTIGAIICGAGVMLKRPLEERSVYLPDALKLATTAITGYGLLKMVTDRRKKYWFGFTVPVALSMATAFAGHYFYKQLTK